MDNDFLATYQYYNFKDPNDKQENGNLKRICLAQYLITSRKIGYTAATSDAIDEKLTEYSNIVDDQNGLNNYATSLEVYTANQRQMNILQWKNELKLSNVKSMIDNIKCCSSNDIEKKDLQEFLKVSTKQYLNFPEKDTSANVFTRNRSPYDNFYCKENNLNSTKNVLPQTTVDQFTNTIKKPALNFTIEKNSFQDQNFQKSGPWITDTRQINNYDQHTKHSARENTSIGFKTAKDELQDQNLLKNSSRSADTRQNMLPEGRKKTLGTRRGVHSKFVPPTKNFDDQDEYVQCKSNCDSEWKSDSIVDERLKNIEPRMVELIKSEIMNSTSNITWNDIAGLEFAKMVIKEVVVLPMLRPDIFTGLRRPPKGILLFGPPGTGKTLIGKCIASQSGSTFFSISASSLTSKWIGDGEKMVRAMFAVARTYQPAVIFIDEIDSLLSQRNETEHESTRRLKTEFLVQLDGAATDSDDRILVIGATNRPKELDEAARRRFVKRLYIPLPDNAARLEIVQNLMKNEKHELTGDDITKVAELTDGFSGADMMNLCSEAALGPVRGIDFNQIQNISTGQLRPTTMQDFQAALTRVRATVSPDDLNHYVEWNKTFGTGNYY